MSERNYYVICDDNCRFESMTKEQILTAIAQAVSTGEIQNVDTGFVTTLKEQNASVGLKFWVGSQAEYNALDPKPSNTFCIITDDTTSEDIDTAIQNMQDEIGGMQAQVSTLNNYVMMLADRPEPNKVLFDGEQIPIDSGSGSPLSVPGLADYSMIAVIVSFQQGIIKLSGSASAILYKRRVNDTGTKTTMSYTGIGYTGALPDVNNYISIRIDVDGNTISYMPISQYVEGQKQDTTVFLRKIIGIC